MREEYLYPMQPCIKRCDRVTRATDWAGMVLLAFFLVFLLSGCALGPDYSTPEIDTPTEWTEVDSAYFDLAPPVDPRWWKKAFQDPELDQLIEEVPQPEPDAAFSRTPGIAGAAVACHCHRFPISAATGAVRFGLSPGAKRPEPLTITTLVSMSAGKSISGDGSVARWNRVLQILMPAVAGYDGVVISLVGQVAQTYILIRTYQDQLDVIRENIRLQEESLKIARAKADAG